MRVHRLADLDVADALSIRRIEWGDGCVGVEQELQFIGRDSETRVTLFQQASDLRQHRIGSSSDERARATLGDGWIEDIMDVWKEERTRMGIEIEEQPEQDLLAVRTPSLSYLQFFNGAVRHGL